VFDVRPRVASGAGYNVVDMEGALVEGAPPAGSLPDRAAIDMSNFWFSEEMALAKVRVISHERYYSCCPESPYPGNGEVKRMVPLRSNVILCRMVPLLVSRNHL
jgi:hypothetical protein